MLAQNINFYNPIDDVECLFAKQYAINRRNKNEIVIELEGKWDNMLFFFAWEESINCLNISCLLNIKAQQVNLPSIFELLALINEDLWVGYFSYWEEMKMPIFKHSIFVDAEEFNLVGKLSQFFDIAVTECEKAYPIFHAVLKQNIPPRKALLPTILM